MFLGELEKKIMDILWSSSDDLSVRRVCDVLNTDQRKRYAYTTVMTILTRLFHKDIVSRTEAGRGFVYRPKLNRATFFRKIGRDVIDTLSSEFGDVAVAHFVEVLDDVDRKKLKKWRSLINKSL